jgi:hypothetical protein
MSDSGSGNPPANDRLWVAARGDDQGVVESTKLRLGGIAACTAALVVLPDHRRCRHTDTEGSEFVTYVEARQEAIETCGQMMQDAADVFWRSRPWSVAVTDASGPILRDIHADGQSSAAGRLLEPRLARRPDDGCMAR